MYFGNKENLFSSWHRLHPDIRHDRQTTMPRATIILMLGALFSRVLGFARDASIAWLLGGSATADALTVALRLPFMVRRLFGDGTLSLTLTVVCVRTKQGISLAQDVTLRLAFFVGIGVIFCCLFATSLLHLLAPGLPHFDQATLLFRISVPYIFFVTLAAGNMAALHSQERFFLPSLAPAVFNIVMISFAGVAWYVGGQSIKAAMWLAGGVFLGGLCQWLLQLPAIIQLRKVFPYRKQKASHIKQVLRQVPSGILGAAMPQIAFLVATALASFQATGHMAAIFYAERLLEFPLSIVGAAIGMAAAPELAQCARNATLFQKTTKRALLFSLALSLPAAAGLMAIAHPLVTLLLQRGAFNEHIANLTSFALIAQSPGLPAYALSRPLLAACHALQKNTLPACLWGICTTLVSGLVLSMLAPSLAISLGLWVYTILLWKSVAVSGLIDLKSLFWHMLASIVTFVAAHEIVVYKTNFSLILAIFSGIFAWCSILILSGEGKRLLLSVKNRT